MCPARAAAQVAGTLKPGSEVQQAVLLLRKYSTGVSPTAGCILPAAFACHWVVLRQSSACYARPAAAHRSLRPVSSPPRAAAAQVEAEGRPDALRQLLSSMPPPGAKEWPSAMALAQGLAGMWSRELELDAPLRLGLGSDSLVIQETKLTAGGEPWDGRYQPCETVLAGADGCITAVRCALWAAMLIGVVSLLDLPPGFLPPLPTPLHRLPGCAGVSKAMRQLRHAFRLVAWLHFALGAPLPRLEGRIVVPHTELREAQRKLHRTSRGVQDSVPGGGGARFDVSIMADTV